uniref:Putative sushi von willebrand factor type a protein n=1 Tax=Rhipicephalus pulchellus TaxID=72859 RepID=L7MB65_RHIPC
MAPRLWLWLHVATAMVAVSFPYRHERHAHLRRSHTEHHHFLGNFLLNGTSGKDSHIGLGRSAEHITPYEGIAQPTPSGRTTRRHQRHRHRRRLHSHRVPDIIYSFGNHSAAKLYRGKGYRVGPYTGYVDVWTIPRQSPLRPLLAHQVTPSPSPPPSPPHFQRQQEHFPEGTAFARVLIAPEPSNAVTPAQPRTCLRCPKDRTVWVGPGFTCAEVPKPRLRPCSRLMSLPGEVHMTATMGPQPGSLVMEGVYQMSFTLQAPGMAPQSCHYKLRVKVRRCPALQRPQHGGARCSQGRHWGSRCRFFCKQGYTLEQRAATRCAIHDGARVTWTPHPAPICREKNASVPDAMTNAIVPSTVMSTRPTTEASVPTTTSNKRFPSTGSPRPPKRWKQLACRWPKAPPNGWVWCDRGSTRKARVVAREGTRCRQGCRWAPLDVVTHFSCVAGVWQRRKVLDCAAPPEAPPTEPPHTTESGCNSRLPVLNAALECSADVNALGMRPAGTICRHVCDKGYEVSPSQLPLAQVTCLANGQWDHQDQPQCVKSGCASPAIPPNSLLNCSNHANHIGNWPTGTTCKFTCDEGFSVPPNHQSLNEIACQEDGTWNQTVEFQCNESGCTSPDPVPDSSLECSENANHLGRHRTGTLCKIVCNMGLGLPPDKQALNQFVCQKDGTWNQTVQLECNESGCKSPDPVPDSSLECSENANHFGRHPTGTLCKIVCNVGLGLPPDMQALNQFVCQEDGTWNQTETLECASVGCTSPNPVADSSLECSTDADNFGKFPTSTTCKVVCADGFALPSGLQSLNQFVCQEDGTWNQTAELECRNSGCSSPNQVPGASLKCSEDGEDLGKWPPGTTCNVVCDDGLALPPTLKSFSSFVCLEDRTWNQSAQLECRESGCAQPDPVPDSSLECSNDANHLGNRPTGTICEVRCNEGFTLLLDLQSSSRFVCQEDGMWNQTVQLECLKSGCANLDLIPDSSLECSNEVNNLGNRPTGTVCNVVCSRGFTLPSNQMSLSEFFCKEDGTWDHDTHLKCHSVTCDNPQNIANAVLECSNGTSEDGKWSMGTLCRYVCKEGYALPKMQDGLDSFVCREDGTWSMTHQFLCEEAGCKSPAQVEHSVLNCTSEANSLGRWPAGTMCSYDCNEGYGLAKSQLPFNRFMCHDDGTWSYTEELRCQKTGCEDPSTVQFSMVNCSESVNTLGRWPVGTECSHVCDEGYALSRDEIHLNLFICLDDGTWNQTEGLHCRETGCEEPGKVPHSAINCSSDFNVLGKRPFGTVCSYVCNEGFAIPLQQLEQHNQFVCSEDGSWNPKEELLCLKTGCESPRVVQNSVLHCSQTANVVGNWPAGTTCQHICDKGFVIPQSQINLKEFICHDDGKWNETDDLQCVKLRDPQLSQGCKDEVVVVDGRNVSFPVIVEAPTFEAFNGTNAVVNCTATQVTTYGTHIIACDAVDSELRSGSSCTYNVTALASGCAALQSDPYSRVSCSADPNVTEGQLHPVGDVCEYICQQHGYVIPRSKVDSALKECLPNGSWSNDDFNLCQKKLDPVLVSGCNRTRITTKNRGNTTVPQPVFRTGSGQLVNATCTPDTVTDYDTFNITCVAEDPELGSKASCEFQMILDPSSFEKTPVV